MTYHIKTKKQDYQLRVGEKITDSGATSTIYQVADNSKVVFKEYKKDFLKKNNPKEVFGKLEKFIANHPSSELDSEEIMSETIHQLAWPKHIVYKNDKPTGFIMDKISFDNSVQFNMLFSIKNRTKHKFTEDITWRLYVAENLARVYAELHKNNYFVIDTKPANIRAYKNVPGVALLDCDGFKIKGLGTDIQMITPDYIAPESIGVSPDKLGEAQDLFSISVLFFQLFNNGIHPFAGKLLKNQTLPIQDRIKEGSYPYGNKVDYLQEPSPYSLHHLFPEKLQNEFNNVFLKNDRPKASEWGDLFLDLKKKQSLGSCPKFKHGKTFKKGCTTCEHGKLTSTNKPSLSSQQQPSEAASEQPWGSPLPPPNITPPATVNTKSSGGNGKRLIIGLIIIVGLLYLLVQNDNGGQTSVGPSSSTVNHSGNRINSQGGVGGVVAKFSNERLCKLATTNASPQKWESSSSYFAPHVAEAKRRGLNCGVEKIETSSIRNVSDETVCFKAITSVDNPSWLSENDNFWGKYVKEAKRRGLSCGVGINSDTLVSTRLLTASPTGCTYVGRIQVNGSVISLYGFFKEKNKIYFYAQENENVGSKFFPQNGIVDIQFDNRKSNKIPVLDDRFNLEGNKVHVIDFTYLLPSLKKSIEFTLWSNGKTLKVNLDGSSKLVDAINQKNC